MEAIADAVHVPVVGSGIPTNSIIPIIETLFNFFILEFIFLSITSAIPLNSFFLLKIVIHV